MVTHLPFAHKAKMAAGAFVFEVERTGVSSKIKHAGKAWMLVNSAGYFESAQRAPHGCFQVVEVVLISIVNLCILF